MPSYHMHECVLQCVCAASPSSQAGDPHASGGLDPTPPKTQKGKLVGGGLA